MEPDLTPTKSEEAGNVTVMEAAAAQKPYLVVCPDMAFYSGKEQSIDCYDLVYTVATDSGAACDQARRALPSGVLPLAAFDQAFLQQIIMEMGTLKLKLGEAYNLSHGMTDAQMQEEYPDDIGAATKV